MLKQIKILTVLTAMFLPTTAFATNGTLNNLKILEVTPNQAGWVTVKFDRNVCHSELTIPGFPPPPPGDNMPSAQIAADQEGRNQLFAAALSAMMAGKAVNVTFVDPVSIAMGPCTITSLALRP